MHICPFVIQIDVNLREWNGEAYATISRETLTLGEVCSHLGVDMGVDAALGLAVSLLRPIGPGLSAAVAAHALSLGWKQPALPFE